MSINAFGITARKPNSMAAQETTPDKPLDAAWMVLEAANDLGDPRAHRQQRSRTGREQRRPAWRPAPQRNREHRDQEDRG